MRSRAVRRLQEPARWVPAALNALRFTTWYPHLNLPDRPRLQRPTYEEPIEIRNVAQIHRDSDSTNQESNFSNSDVDAG